ncbi:TonB-dependent receptor domain-containing protein [Roseateles sp.]|uniref:TonB-dependent receptor domain-containing protein n=1 Tax=Roseateles sp. TaxID=1971397 RepID=UPI0037CAF67B
MKLTTLARSLALIGLSTQLAGVALAQQSTTPTQKVERVEITGSSIKRIAAEGALPVQVISRAEMEKSGIVTVEQLIADLNINGNGMDNLASNADVAAGSARGNNGSSSANLRGQGSSSTLVLLNGRRIASHGLNGGSVDLNQIPFAAVERVEVLKDGASAIYGTDAIGGVINFILRRDYTGLQVSTFVDATEGGGGNISRTSLVGGLGNLETNGFNLLGTLMLSDSKALRGDQRGFVNTFQPNRGLSVDTRGTPYATVFPVSGFNTILNRVGSSAGPIQPGTTQQMGGGINVLDLPGQAGCGAMDGGGAYDEVLWNVASAKWACAYDTGRAAVLQQPVKNTNLVLRGTMKLGDNNLLIGEFIRGRSESEKRFSHYQISTSALSTSATFNVLYPRTGSSYDSVFNEIAKVFPSIAGNYGAPIAFRWRCIDCGNREISTTSDTGRAMLGLEGSWGSWDYKAGVSSAYSESQSELGGGYYYTTGLMDLIKAGTLNPFVLPGQKQTDAALAALAAQSAAGTTLYGGKFTLKQADASASGPVYKLPAGDVMAAVGLDLRRETFQFRGDERTTQTPIFLAPFDNTNLLPKPVSRDVKAVYGELLVPVTKSLELTGALRRDDYTGFGSTVNPKVSARFTASKDVLLRGSYSTGFRVPTFNQVFFGVSESAYSGKDLVDPAKCPTLKVDPTKPGCESITPTTLFGGKSNLGPEESKQATLGIVWQPMPNLIANLDWWTVQRDGTIQALTLTSLVNNYALFSDRFIRDGAGNLVTIDQRWINAGETQTSGLEFGTRYNTTADGKKLTLGADVAYLLKKKSRLIANQPFGSSEIGVFSRSNDLGLRWKHTAFMEVSQGDWTGRLTQVYRSGYKDYALPGVAAGLIKPAEWNPNVKPYVLHHVSATYRGIKNLTMTFGVKNIFNQDPPFSAAYDSDTGAGSSWDPRVADPRGRSYTASLSYSFK